MESAKRWKIDIHLKKKKLKYTNPETGATHTNTSITLSLKNSPFVDLPFI